MHHRECPLKNIQDVSVVEDNNIKKTVLEKGYKGNWKRLGDILKNCMQNCSIIKEEQSELAN